MIGAAKSGKRRVELLEPIATVSEFGEPVISFTSAGTLWMEVRDVSSREKLRSDEIQARVDTRFRVRYSTAAAAVKPTWRLSLDGKTYNITGIRESWMRRWLEFDAVARNDA